MCQETSQWLMRSLSSEHSVQKKVAASSRFVPAIIWMWKMGAIDLSIERGEQSTNAEWSQECCFRKRERDVCPWRYWTIDRLATANVEQVHIKEHPFLLRKFISVPCGQKEVANTGRVRSGFAPSLWGGADWLVGLRKIGQPPPGWRSKPASHLGQR